MEILAIDGLFITEVWPILNSEHCSNSNYLIHFRHTNPAIVIFAILFHTSQKAINTNFTFVNDFACFYVSTPFFDGWDVVCDCWFRLLTFLNIVEKGKLLRDGS